MNVTMLNKTIKTSILIFIVVFSTVMYFMEGNALKSISPSFTVVGFIWFLYFKFAWKLPVFNLLFKVPNLNGTWVGSLKSDWLDDNGNTVDEMDFYIVVKQKFLNLHIKTFTNKYCGKSYIEKIEFKEKEDEIILAYFYDSDLLSSEEDLRQGVAELIVLNDEGKTLNGKYWTRNKTSGVISLKHFENQHYSTFEQIKNKLHKGGSSNV
ncbi:hypothetical protein [Paenibacillus xylanexedens]|uniref:CD-NTase-associated protein 15 domain-containing protein n=1 Tax=Paenibacillus xylanexedens TaxID=528191 RepID=A0ABS4S1D4_PAEXY|nr:hypothetical protein [Paenibacillus xylanexedens]MBP2248943.1 hypothetical protein [Paenibacillus xylanexedens]